MYGTGDAAQNWQRRCSETVRELGFVTGKVTLCHFYHDKWCVCGMAHGDEFVFARESSHIKGTSALTPKRFKVSVMGPKGSAMLRVLHCSWRWAQRGVSSDRTTGTRKR